MVEILCSRVCSTLSAEEKLALSGPDIRQDLQKALPKGQTLADLRGKIQQALNKTTDPICHACLYAASNKIGSPQV